MRHVWILLILAGCATTAQKPSVDSWLLKPEWTQITSFNNAILTGRSGQKYQVIGLHMENLKGVMQALKKQSQLDPHLALIASDTPNAFATLREGKLIVGLTLSMLNRIGPDIDALATTIGHELAHLKLNHGDTRKRRAESAKGASTVLGALLDIAGVPMGSTMANVGVDIVTTAYSRDEERDADLLGLQWATAAGYSACGSARTMQVLEAHNRSVPIPFLSSHPGHDERIKRASETARAITGTGC